MTPKFLTDWTLSVSEKPPGFHLMHVSGFAVQLSIYDGESSLWTTYQGLALWIRRVAPQSSVPSGMALSSSRRAGLIKQARKVVEASGLHPRDIPKGEDKQRLLAAIQEARKEYSQTG